MHSSGKPTRSSPLAGQEGTCAKLRLGLALVAGFALLESCTTEPVRALDDIERLAFVRAGRSPRILKIEWGSDDDLLVDRYEVTRAQWLKWTEEREVAGQADWARPWTFMGPESVAGSASEGRLPATSMSLTLARRFAHDHHMRLPTADEWLHIASGKHRFSYPWGTGRIESCTNTLELGLGRLVPVGSFEQSKSPHGVYDLIGNVWEWVDRPVEHGVPLLTPSLVFEDDRWVMGGSFASRLDPLHTDYKILFAKNVGAGYRAADVGLRRITEAGSYIRARAEELSDPQLRERLIAVGERWGMQAISLLEDLQANDGRHKSIAWLLEGARR
ncbi:MAG: hypothetical protein ACI841_001866 [Planctomycetota bacterium]|jgi:hypothetical protein